MDCEADTLQFSALIEEYIYEKPEGSRRFYSITEQDIQSIAEKMLEYFSGETTSIDGNRIYLQDTSNNFVLQNVGIVQFFRDEPHPTFFGVNIEELQKEKKENNLKFLIIVGRNEAGILFIKEVDDKCSQLELDIS